MTATKGDQFVRVSTFPVAKIYTPKLFAKLGAELKIRMTTLAKQTGGTVEGTGVATADGIKSHVWHVKTGDSLDEYTFVLEAGASTSFSAAARRAETTSACVQLVSTFHLT